LFLTFSVIWFDILGRMVLMTEPISISLFLIGMVLSVAALREQGVWRAIGAGAAFALSAYFRNTSENFILVLTALAIGSVAVLLALRRFFPSFHAGDVRRLATVLGLVIVSAHLVMVPWRLYNYATHDNLSWSQTLGFFLRVTWKDVPSEQSIFVRHGGTIPCHLDRATCNEVSEKLKREGEWQVDNATLTRFFVASFANHWPEWIAQKARIFFERWIYEDKFDQADAWSSPYLRHRFLENILLLTGWLIAPLMIAGAIVVGRERRTEAILLAMLYVSITATLVVTSILFHIEPRYLYPWKLGSLLLMMMSGLLLWQGIRRNAVAARGLQNRVIA
jgi:hypothetical protein